MTELAILELGSNIEPEANLPRAVSALSEIGNIRAISKAYRTEPFGPPGQPPFVNAALSMETDLEPLALRQRLRQIEADIGRQRGFYKYAPRAIDIDLCLYGQRTLNQERLELPDPDIFERPYLARTIAEIAPDFMHPVAKTSMADIANELDPEHSLEPDPALSESLLDAWQEAET